MKFANLEIVKLLRPRLGFGSPETSAKPTLPQPPPPPKVPARSTEVRNSPRRAPYYANFPDARTGPERPLDPVPGSVVQTTGSLQEDAWEAGDDTRVSLLRLADELESALKTAPPAKRAIASQSLKALAAILAANDLTPETKPLPKIEEPGTARNRNGLEGCKVAAIGFGRQDISGLATTMIDRRARIEFLPRGEMSRLLDFDLLLINASSAETLKREADSLRNLLETGIPAIVIGSRAVLSLLRDSADPSTWDFASKPIHFDELAWRAVNLLTRNNESGVPRRLPARVVVADPDPFTRSLIDSSMARLGVQCQLTEDGEAAWNAIEESEPGIVILDLTLPGRDGFQLLADIRRAPGRKPKVIVLSARQSEADILRAFSLGADDYIIKPFSPLELGARLTRLLGGATALH